MAIMPAISQRPAFSPEDGEGEVYLWRRDQFRELGFSSHEAAELALSDAELGQARYLLASGCALELALQILR
jgi:hypothetical protein